MGGTRRVPSTISKLPPEIRERVDDMLTDCRNTYRDIEDWLQDQGYTVSHSAIGRYGQRQRKAAERTLAMLEQTRTIVDAVAQYPDMDYSKAARVLLLDAATQRLASTDPEEMDELPLDKIGKIVADLSRVEAAEQSSKRAYKSKAERALDAMEAQLMDSIKQDPELSARLHEVLTQARERITADD